jgi:hypothetical protein
MGCGDITIGSQYDCEDPLYGGTKPRLLLINLDDISSFTTSTVTPHLITAFTLKTGKVAHAFTGFKNSVLPSWEKVSAPSGQALYRHMVNFFIYENTQVQKNNIQKLGNGKFIAIIQNSTIDDNAFEVLGIGQGLELQDGAINNKSENSGAYNLVLASAENQTEAKLPQTFFDESAYSSTLDLLDGYAAIPTVTNISDLAIDTAGGNAETITGTEFHGGGSASDIQSVKWVNQSTGAKTTQTAVTTASDTSLTFSSVALVAGTYKLEVRTSRGTALSVLIVTVS